MPISATGSNRDRGFTLVELMVVLAIVGLMSAVVVFAMPDPRGSLAGEAERFAARALAARDDAIVKSRATRLQVDAGGYRFELRQNGLWTPVLEKPFAPAQWAKGIRSNGAIIVFDPTGLVAPASQIVLSRDEERVSVAIDPDGGVHVGR